MPLFRRRRKAASVPVEVTPRLVEILRTFDGTLGSYGTVYRQLAPVRTVVDFLADAVSTTSLKVHRRTASGRPEVRDHPLSVLLRHPNPELTTERLVAGTVRDVAVYGMAYWRKIERGTQKWVVPLPPYRVIPRGGDLLAPSRFDLQIPGQPPVTLSRDEVVLFRTYDPEDRRVGASKLEALRTILAEEVEVSRHRREFWRNAARREGVIKRPLDAPPWSEDARDRFRESWRGRTAGTRNAGLTGILEEGMDWVPDSFSPKESEFVEGRKFILEATARVFNLQVALLGLTETATFASQKEFSKSLYQVTLPPWYGLIESEIDLQLLPWFDTSDDPDVYTEFNVESKLRGSFEEQAAILSTAVGQVAWMTRDELRDRLNLPALPGQGADQLILPLNMAPSGQPMPALPAPKALRAFFERQSRSVLSRIGAKGVTVFDEDRWNAELSELVPASTAGVITAWTRRELDRYDGDQLRQAKVFEELKTSAERLEVLT